VLVFEDETGFSKHPRVTRVWTRPGQRRRVPTRSEHRQRLNVFGWVAPLTGWHGLLRLPRGNTRAFLTLLRRLRHRLRGKRIHLYVDRAPWHRGLLVDAYLAAHPDLRLDYLPSYQPGLNPQERIWRQIRYERTSNRWFSDLDQTWIAIRDSSRRWSLQKIRRLCNIR
jgi:transposase